MNPADRYRDEAPAPQAATLHETVRYQFDETQRRAFHSTDGLTDADLSVDPGNGAWSIGQILKHQLFLVRFITETLKPGSTDDIPKENFGPDGAWDLAGMCGHREVLNERCREVFSATPPDALLEKRPDMPPEQWADWPVLMRIQRPIVDIATHVGQVNYARRQLGKPVGRN